MLRLIGIIVILAIFLVFIGLNVDNRCHIQYWFGENNKLSDVPVYLTAFASFALGMFWALPVALSIRWKKAKARKTKAQEKEGKRKKSLSAGKDDDPAGSPPAEQEESVDQGAYGID